MEEIGVNSLGCGESAPEEVDVFIEISQNSLPVKYEMDKRSGFLKVDRFLLTSMHYPCNYGFIPGTIAGDGDPADVLVLTRFPVMPGVIISSRPVGVLMMRDEAGEDVKILAVPAAGVDPYYEGVRSYRDLPMSLLESVEHFFSSYKDLEKGKVVSVGNWEDAVVAKQLVLSAINLFNEKKN